MTKPGAPPAEDAATRRRLARMAARQAARAAGRPPPPKPAPDPMMGALTREDVAAAYGWLLGRAPEDEDVVTRILGRLATPAALREELLRSGEFRGLVAAIALPGPPLDAPPMAVGTEAGAAALEAMQTELRKGWARLGETLPHWSCLPNPAFRPERLPRNRRAFHASGRLDRSLLEAVLARHGIPLERLGHLVDFGCGVGRATLHLAAISPRVTGVDISAPHLALARQEARARGLDHIAWLRSRADLPMPVQGYDLWFSRRVLQHVPPPLALHLLRLAFAGLAPGGVAVFQAATLGLGYGYDPAAPPTPAETALAETHALPQAAILGAAAEAGLRVLDVQEDPVPGLDRARWLSHLFVLARP
ncbi:class I SAM-dependent methyltransferase [Roseomonas sp. AR75]|uniref:class I SAM-dependent methyltransferase n=1 Tax=Roseomonas sp. AR75 TaxID=2562311 RepID=UPI0010C14AA9|nr:class I SAM-dependent methyltransferase [Roseomonas sp. AR75]